MLYTRDAASGSAAAIGLKRSVNWLAFHAALVAGLVITLRQERFKLTSWLVLSAAALLLGNHFAPRYFFQILPVMVIGGARGLVLGLDRYGRPMRIAVALLLLAPLIRFGPRYVTLTWDNIHQRQPRWSDAALDLDSQKTALLLNRMKQPSATLFVWGYRPDIYVYTRLMPPGRFWDSQALDGVPADRHLESSQSADNSLALANRTQLVQTRPTFIVDGLGLLNPKLALGQFPEVATWLGGYQLVGETGLSRIYLLKDHPSQ
jgi:hypothetical protein